MITVDQIKANTAAKQSGATLANDVSTLGNLATTYTQQSNIADNATSQVIKTPTNLSWMEGVGKFALDVGSGAVNLVSSGIKYIADEAVKTFTGGLVGAYTSSLNLAKETDALNMQRKMNEDKQNKLMSDYHAGRINQQEYIDGLKALNWEDLSNKSAENAQKANDLEKSLPGATVATAIDVAAVLAAIPTAGGSLSVTMATRAAEFGAKDVAQAVAKDTVAQKLMYGADKVNEALVSAMNVTNRITTFGGKMTTGTIFQLANETVGATVASATAKDIARNVAFNLLLKKPIVYTTNVDLASSVYTELLKGDFSGASRDMLLTSAMVLSGGPIGYGMQLFGKGLDWLKSASYNPADRKVFESFLKDVEKEVSGTSTSTTEKAAITTAGEFIHEEALKGVTRTSFIDSASGMFGTGELSQLKQYIANELAKGNDRPYKVWRVAELTNMKMQNDDAYKAASGIFTWFRTTGTDLSKMSAKEVTDSLDRYFTSREIAVRDAIAQGMSKADAERIVIGRANQQDLNAIADVIVKADNAINPLDSKGFRTIDITEMSTAQREQLVNARLAAFQELIYKNGMNTAWANSETFINQVSMILQNNFDTDVMLKEIRGINVGKLFEGLSKEASKKISKDGYFAIMPKLTRTPYHEIGAAEGKLTTSFTNGAENEFSKAVAPVPILQHLNSFLTRIGLSPNASAEEVQTAFQNSFARVVTQEAGKVPGELKTRTGQSILTDLYNFIREHNNSHGMTSPIMDLRQLRMKEIQKALSSNGKRISEEEAKAVMVSLNSSMLQVPYQLKGLGGRILDYNDKLNPFASQFARYQGAGRFTWNPFFRWQQSWQTEFFAQAEAGGKQLQVPFLNRVNKVLFKDKQREVDNTIALLEDKNIFGSGLSGMGASADIQGLIGTRILHSEKVSLAGLVNEQARKMGMNAEEYVNNNFDRVVDTLQTITGNYHGKDWFDSPMARTLNIAFFPMRFNLKIAGVIAQYMSKLPAPTQVAMIWSYYKADDWLKSDDGIAWQTQYASAIQFFNWVTPTYPLSYVMKLGNDITGRDDFSIGDFGQLGGLPFGMITQILEANGIINTSSPYVNPDNGDVYQKYVPQTARAEINLAVQAFLGSMFTYPGAMLNLPSKGRITRAVANNTIGAGNEFTPVDQTGKLTPRQQHQVEVIKQTVGSGTQTATPAPTTAKEPVIVPKTSLPTVPNRSTSSGRRKVYARPMQ